MDLGSAHGDGPTRARYRSLIGQIQGVNPTSCLLGRTAWEGGKRAAELEKSRAREPMM